jgi:hypothetical protein
MFDTVQGPEVFFADKEFAYDADKKKIYRLDDRKNLIDLKTGKKIGKSLILTSLANTPGYEIKKTQD